LARAAPVERLYRGPTPATHAIALHHAAVIAAVIADGAAVIADGAAVIADGAAVARDGYAPTRICAAASAARRCDASC
jgi:hypothetical protein